MDPQHTIAFQALKNKMSSSPVLALPDFSQSFTLETEGNALEQSSYSRENQLPFIAKPWDQKH
jgi:hypothetical protein